MIIKVWVSTNLVGCKKESEVEIPDVELSGLSEELQNKLCEEYASEEIAQMCEWGWIRVSEEV